jgi:hypothetical protein
MFAIATPSMNVANGSVPGIYLSLRKLEGGTIGPVAGQTQMSQHGWSNIDDGGRFVAHRALSKTFGRHHQKWCLLKGAETAVLPAPYAIRFADSGLGRETAARNAILVCSSLAAMDTANVRPATAA